MISEEQIEQIVERLVDRIEKANTKFLKSIGSSIKIIKDLTPSEAQQLIQILKYGGKYENIIREISKITNLNIKDIEDIFYNYAKRDQLFYEKFYKYKDIPFTPFEQNSALKTQTMALSNIVKNEMYNFTRSNVLGYTINGKFYNLRDTYNQLLDEALLNVGQGKETFDSAMKDILEQVGGSGLKTLNYESGRSIRLDSAIRMHLQGRLRELHNENQKIIGSEFGADGYEISVHENPAEDHEQVQGRQFSLEEYDKLNSGLEAVDYKGKTYTLDHDGKNGYRPISEMNCYHYVFSIILGVSEPEYDDKQLNQIINSNNKGFEFEGKHYTNYQGTQMQRNLERAIREQKDTQILAKASGNDLLVGQSQEKIRILTNKYKELSDISGLPTKADRLRVSGYKRTKVKSLKNNEPPSYAVHYGDLGKGRDTYFWNINSSNRSTGHYGTGTYFVSKEESERMSSRTFSRNDRQIHEVDFNEYELYKPLIEPEASRLHEGLKAVNYANYDNFEFRIMKDDLKRKGISEEKINNAVEKVEKTRQEYKNKGYDNDYEGKYDSLSTVFMKELGYNGIDVRGLEGFDNTGYGSVIYDLKKKKKRT